MKGARVCIKGGEFRIDGEGTRHPRHGTRGDCLCALMGGSTNCEDVTVVMEHQEHPVNSVFTFIHDHDDGQSYRGGHVSATNCKFQTSCRTIVGAMPLALESDPAMHCELTSCHHGGSAAVAEHMGALKNVRVAVGNGTFGCVVS